MYHAMATEPSHTSPFLDQSAVIAIPINCVPIGAKHNMR